MEEDGEYLFHSQKASSANLCCGTLSCYCFNHSFHHLFIQYDTGATMVVGELLCFLRCIIVEKKFVFGFNNKIIIKIYESLSNIIVTRNIWSAGV